MALDAKFKQTLPPAVEIWLSRFASELRCYDVIVCKKHYIGHLACLHDRK